MKIRPIMAAILMLLCPVASMAANITEFEGCQPEVIASLYEPGFKTTVNITVPAECHILKATMNVSALVPDKNNPDCPEAVRIFLNDTLLWEFNRTDFGGLGRQERFICSTAEWQSRFDLAGGTNSTKVCLPKKAVIQNATMEISCSGQTIDQYACFTRAAEGDMFGNSVSDAGDVNNDGYDDIIVGAMCNDVGGLYPNGGRAYLYLGGPGMDYEADAVFSGAGDDSLFGFSVSGVGDVNRDGFDDLVIGAQGYKEGASRVGRAYLFFGGKKMDNTADVVFTGIVVNGHFGCSVSGAGDVNGDGYDDVVVGASDAGHACVYLGGESMDNLSDVVLEGNSGAGYFGNSVSDAGDVNGDGYDDVVVGAYASSTAFIYFGGASMDNAYDLILAGTRPDYFGYSVSGAGDVNDDGYDDVAVGAFYGDAAYIYFGGPKMDSVADASLSGAAPGEYFGYSVSGIGDMNDDGYDDVVVGAMYNDAGGANAGRAYVFYGGAKMDGTDDAVLAGCAPADWFGSSVSGAGDLDADGFADMLVGAMGNAANGTMAGCAYICKMMAGVKEAGVSLGEISVWNNSTYFNGTALLGDFGPKLDRLLRDSASAGKDEYGNSYANVSVQVACRSKGNITLEKLRIVYSLDAILPDFKNALNLYIAAHKAEKDTDGNLLIPFFVFSRTPGRLKLNDLLITADVAPEPVQSILDVEMAEDSVEPELLDLYEYFKDDYDAQERLKFTIVSTTNVSFVQVKVDEDRFLSADAQYGTANDNWTGEVAVELRATDHWGSGRLSTFKIIVTNVNDAPVITSQPPTTGATGQEYSYRVVSIDGDNDTLVYDLLKRPDKMTVDASTGMVRWVPSKGGRFDVTVAVSDGKLSASQAFSITVPNRPPRVTNTAVPMAYANEPYAYPLPIVDDDDDRLVFTMRTDITGMKVDPSSGNLTWTPTQTGNFSVAVSVFDGTDTLYHDFIIKVVQRNRPPKFSGSPRIYATVGLPYFYDANATDPDNDPLTFQPVELPAGMTLDNATGEIRWIPNAPGNFTVRIAVSDARGGQIQQEFTITVRDRLRAKVEFTAPAEGQNVKGKLAIAGKVTKGTLEVVGVQLCVDSGEWINVTGNTTWQYTLDTARLKNGRHLLAVRAFDGMDYSDIVERRFAVDNQNAQSKGLIPGFTGVLAGLVLVSIAFLVSRRRKSTGEVAN